MQLPCCKAAENYLTTVCFRVTLHVRCLHEISKRER